MLSGEVTTQYLKLITDTNVICSTLKDFFRNMIDQPLLTWAAMPSFIQAYKDENTSMLKELFAELPDDHRDTLAFMLIHLIQVFNSLSNKNNFQQEFLTQLRLTPTGKVTNKLVALFSLKMAERSEAESVKRSFASKIKIRVILTRNFASRF